MSQQRGYYSLVQFCPDPSRLESVNIGVVLYSSSEKRLECRISHSTLRIRKFFGDQNWNLVKRARAAVERQLKTEKFLSIDDLNAYIARRANMIQLTPPRPMRITDLESDTIELHNRLVGPEPKEPKRRKIGELDGLLFEAGVAELVRRPVKIEIGFNKTIQVPYSYQNGRRNLIAPVRFDDPEKIFEKTASRAIEGEILFQQSHPEYGAMQLIVVAKFDDQVEIATRESVAKKLRDHDVVFYAMDNIRPLVENIKEAAAAHSEQH